MIRVQVDCRSMLFFFFFSRGILRGPLFFRGPFRALSQAIALGTQTLFFLTVHTEAGLRWSLSLALTDLDRQGLRAKT